MKVLVYFGHPAQYYFMKYAIKSLRKDGHTVVLIIKSKDFLESLLNEDSEEYINILPEGREKSKVSILWGLIKRDIRLFKYVANKHFDLFVGSDPSLAHIGWLRRIPVVTILEDDIEIISSLAKLTYPFTSCIITPACVRVGKYKDKQLTYNGYMKLAYLHPRYFQPKIEDHYKRSYLIRLSALNAYHDNGVHGIDENLLDKLISVLTVKGTVYISSERELPSKYHKYQFKLKFSEIHQLLSQVVLLISDSQSMSVEAAMIGIPSIRFSDFAGKISVLEELEHKYQLTFGIPTSKPHKVIQKVDELINDPNLSSVFNERRIRMLSDKIDVTAFMVWFIENYPKSYMIIKSDPHYQDRFKQTTSAS
jgi:uncharacterized protein